jgi:hypothetical protein
MIIHVLAKLYGIVLEKNISIWLERNRERDKGQTRFMSYHSNLDNLLTLRITAV